VAAGIIVYVKIDSAEVNAGVKINGHRCISTVFQAKLQPPVFVYLARVGGSENISGVLRAEWQTGNLIMIDVLQAVSRKPAFGVNNIREYNSGNINRGRLATRPYRNTAEKKQETGNSFQQGSNKFHLCG